MTVAIDSRLSTVALVMTALVVLQAIWIGIRLSMMANPEIIVPAESSLKVSSLAHAAIDPIQAGAVRARPLFWQGREAFVVVDEEPEVEIVASGPDSGVIQGVKLLGVYGAGPVSSLIVVNGGERTRVHVGDKIGDWQFTMMSAEGAVFEAGDETRVLELIHAVPVAKSAKGRAPVAKRTNTKRASAKRAAAKRQEAWRKKSAGEQK